MTNSNFTAIILAAGKGTRMKSDMPKVLHPICGRPMIHYPLIAAREAGAKDTVIVIGHGGESVKSELAEQNISYAIQEEQLGTGHAVLITEDAVKSRDIPVVVLCGDAPLIEASTLSALVERHITEKNSVTVLTAEVEDSKGYGRIVKDGDQILKIVEEKDASSDERKINEINSGVYSVDPAFLFDALKSVGNDNSQGEFYLTDIIEIGKDKGERVGWAKAGSGEEIMGINSRRELALADGIMRRKVLDSLMDEGVSILDPDNTYVDFGVEVGRDSKIYPQVRIEGDTTVGEETAIETGSIIKDSIIGDTVHIRPYSVVDNSKISGGSAIGPFAHLRPGTVLKNCAKVGNFVEIKKSVIGNGSKVNHLTYIGDSEIGKDVNIGAGTVTCNYDGYEKFKTVIEDGAFVGSGSNLVAPVKIGSGCVIGSGSTITKEVPADSLALTRSEQRVIAGWAKKRREAKGKK